MAVEGVAGLFGSLAPSAILPGSSEGAPAASLPGVSRGPGDSGKAESVDVEVVDQGASTAVPAVVISSTNFVRDKSTGLVTIKIVNSTTGEVIRRIPIRDYVQIAMERGNAKGALFEARR